MIDMLDMKAYVQNLTPEKLIWCPYKISLISQYFPHLEHQRPEIWYISSMTNGEQLLIKTEL